MIRKSILTVSDLHRNAALYGLLSDAISIHHPDVTVMLGDFLDFSGAAVPQKTTQECALLIAGLDVAEIVFVRGNHEDADWWNFQDAWKKTGRKLTKLHGEAEMFGPATVIGFPCLMGDEAAFVWDRPPLPGNPGSWLSHLLEKHGACIRSLWLMHEPPSGTPLSQANSPVSGNRIWRTAIERFMPILTVSGHDHQTPIRYRTWHHRIGSTTCVNVGQTECGPPRYCLVESEFASNVPSLPVNMTVTAYPKNETVVVYPPLK